MLSESFLLQISRGLQAQLLLGDDPAQRLRISRFLLAAVTYLICGLLVVTCQLLGFFPAPILARFVLLALLANTLLYGMLRSGLNRHFRDPALTELQLVIASAITLYVMYYAGLARGAFLIGYMIIFVFGIFALDTRRYLRTAAFAIAGYGGLILLLWKNQPEYFHLKMELMQLITVGASLFWLAFIGGYISNLRHRLKASNAGLHSALATIEALASHDELTTVFNRRYLIEALQRESQLALNTGSGFSIAMLDLDHFKQVNDQFGHVAGDALLKQFALHAVRLLRASDIFGRYGGEEFLVILPHTPLLPARSCLDKIRKEMAEHGFDELPASYRATVSIGVAQYRSGEDWRQTLERADAALYAAKHLGRNRTESAAI